MFTLPRVVVPAMVLAACLLGSASLRAEYTVLSGMFDGSEPIAPSFWGERCAHGPSGYLQVEFTVSTTGSYAISDAFRNLYSVGGVSVAYKLYVGGYTPADPSLNLRYTGGDGSYLLNTGFTYVLLLQDRCVNREGAWSVVVSGPGPISSKNVVAVPGFTKGNFTANDPTLPTPGCTREVSAYEQSGPIRVSRSGTYYFSQGNVSTGPYVSVRVYTSPVNPRESGSEPRSL
jgi:hypothetical protein